MIGSAPAVILMRSAPPPMCSLRCDPRRSRHNSHNVALDDEGQRGFVWSDQSPSAWLSRFGELSFGSAMGPNRVRRVRTMNRHC
jgi:hypothetical protein